MAPARRAAVLVDGADYFRHLERALSQARRSIIIVGWDFDGRIALDPRSPDGMPLGRFLRSLVERNAELEIRILMWSVGVIHGPGAMLPKLLGASWQDHPRIQVHLDRKHPVYGAQHQKIVCVDDALAFTGGIDLTVGRWDTPDHPHRDPRRVDPDGKPYPPVHDVQIVVDGEAAEAIADVVRRRWRLATGEPLAPARAAPGTAWPEGLEPEFRDVPVGVACSGPRSGDVAPIGDAAMLALDAIARARRSLYIEAQYLTARRVGTRLAERLAEPDGPEIVVLLTHSSPGLLERLVMGANRDRLLRRLRRADRHDRLRVYLPVVPGPQGDCGLEIHSKVIVVDDALVRIGSSNLNNRSMGLDIECDVAIEARDAAARAAIQRLRDRLVAEHVGSDPQTVGRTVASEGSLIRAIERLNVKPRGLRPFAPMLREGPTRPLPLTWLLDPERPLSIRSLWRRWRGAGRGRS